METTLIHSLKVFSEAGAVTDPEIFQMVFDAWQKHKQLLIIYDDKSSGTVSEWIVDVQVLFFYLRQWRIKAYCHLRKSYRTFVIDRIKRAEVLENEFKPDMQIINSITPDNIVSYRKLENVKILLKGDAVKFALANNMHSKQKIVQQADGSTLFYIPAVAGEVIIPWILSQQGNAVPLEPAELKISVQEKVRQLQNALLS
jgi:predicted DNA-binding transcriptional regulator YafY